MQGERRQRWCVVAFVALLSATPGFSIAAEEDDDALMDEFAFLQEEEIVLTAAKTSGGSSTSVGPNRIGRYRIAPGVYFAASG